MAAEPAETIVGSGPAELGSISSSLSVPVELEARVSDSLSDELGFPVYTWVPSHADARAIVVAIHGVTLHGRSYEHLAAQLADRGYMVFAIDMRGFGAWVENDASGDPHILYRQSQADLLNLLSHLRRRYPKQEIFLMGESAGANMAMSLLALDPFCADGLILGNPAVDQRFFLGPTILKQLLIVMFRPKAQLSVEPYLKSRISEDPRIVEERIFDPLARNHMNVGELWKTRWFNKHTRELAPCIPEFVPVLVVVGTEDRIFEVSDVKNLMESLRTDNKEMFSIEGRGHINLETKYLHQGVLKKIVSWLDKETSRTAKSKPNKVEVSAADRGE